MFTGIIEELGKISMIKRGARSVTIDIAANKVLLGTNIGDSIAVNGVCLTVTYMGNGTFRADAMPETMKHTNLGNLVNGDIVNLERALTLQTRLGGHLVSGHIDGLGTVSDVRRDDNAVRISIKTSADILKYIADRGSIAVNGISLTVVGLSNSGFELSIIPHTQGETTLSHIKAGDKVNLEVDLIMRYLERLTNKNDNLGISLEFLAKNGF